MKTNKKTSSKKDIAILKKAIKKELKPDEIEALKETVEHPKEEIVEPTHQNLNTNQEIAQPLQEVKKDTAIDTATNPLIENQNNPISEPIQETGVIDIFEQLKQGTQEDLNKASDVIESTQSTVNKIEEVANNLNDVTSDEIAEDLAKKEGYKAKASIIVELCDVGFMVICILISWDFTDENQKRFTLNSERKKAIQHNLYKIYCLDNKKVNPKKDIWFLVLGSYTPMLIVAVLMLFRRMKAKQELKEKEKQIKILEARHRAEKQDLINQIEEAKDEQIFLHNQLKNNSFKNDLSIPNLKKDKEVEKQITMHLTGDLTPKKRGVKKGVKRGSYKKRS